MDTESEIHAINNKMTEIVGAIDSLKEKRIDDKQDTKDDITALTEIVNKLVISLNQLNLTLKYKDGQIDGASKTVKIFRFLISSLVFITIVSTATTIIDLYARVAVLEAE